MPEGGDGESQASLDNGDGPDLDIFRCVTSESANGNRTRQRSVDSDVVKVFVAHHSVLARSSTQPTQRAQYRKLVVNQRNRLGEGARKGRDSPQHLLQLHLNLVDSAFQVAPSFRRIGGTAIRPAGRSCFPPAVGSVRGRKNGREISAGPRPRRRPPVATLGVASRVPCPFLGLAPIKRMPIVAAERSPHRRDRDLGHGPASSKGVRSCAGSP